MPRHTIWHYIRAGWKMVDLVLFFAKAMLVLVSLVLAQCQIAVRGCPVRERLASVASRDSAIVNSAVTYKAICHIRYLRAWRLFTYGVDFGGFSVYNTLYMLMLEAVKRNKKEKIKEGYIPAVFYGLKEPSESISISTRDFKRVWDGAGESSIISLKVAGKEHEALIHDVDFHPVSGEPRHADFYVIEKGKKVTVDVPLEFIGVAPAVKELGGVLVKVLYEIEIEALPKDLPHQIDVDLSSLVDFEKTIAVKDLKFPEGVVPTENPEEIIAMVHEAKEEVIEEVPAPDLSSIEVEKKGKEEEPPENAEATTTGGKEN